MRQSLLGILLTVALAALAPLASATPTGHALAPLASARPSVDASALQFEVDEGLNLNRFLRDGDVAAHLVLHSGRDPRILIVFPAGNSGVGLWFNRTSTLGRWRLDSIPRSVADTDSKGRTLRGVTVGVSIATPELEITQALLSSVRVLRNYQARVQIPDSVTAPLRQTARQLRWERDRLDGAPGYRLVVEVTHGSMQDSRIRASSDGRIGLRLTGLTGETPLQGISGAELLASDQEGVGSSSSGPPSAGGEDSAPTGHSGSGGPRASARDTLTFLAYREKLLAGSWRFDTYFGRDTLMSVRLMLPALAPEAIEAALASVLVRLSPDGEVAHEEDIGEFAVLEHLTRDGTRSDAPIYDYKMVDGDYLLAPVLAAWLLDDSRSRTRGRSFLAEPVSSGNSRVAQESRGTLLLRNLRRVVRSAAMFAAEPGRAHLIGLKPGFPVGNWRDSEQGLGGGRYPYDVNAVLVPAALMAVARLHESKLIEPYETADDADLFSQAGRSAAIWRKHAPPMFEVRKPAAVAAKAVDAYARALSLPPPIAHSSFNSDDVVFHALALDADGAVIPVMHSDEGFALLFGEPDEAMLEGAAQLLLRPFPAGLMTAAGMVVANPVFAPPAIQGLFTSNAYHGTVVWSWQQALFAAGLERQLARPDLSGTARSSLQKAQTVLWAAIRSNQALRNSELWSWTVKRDRLKAIPFGIATADADESNAAQLWSTVYLAVRPPAR